MCHGKAGGVVAPIPPHPLAECNAKLACLSNYRQFGVGAARFCAIVPGIPFDNPVELS